MASTFGLVLLLLGSFTVQAAMVERTHAFGTGLTGLLMYDDALGDAGRPGLLVLPGVYGDGGGVADRTVGRKYANMGMVVFLADYMAGTISEDNFAEVMAGFQAAYALLHDTKLAQETVLLNLHQLTSLSMVDPDKIGVIGFCYGGAMALNLARAGGKAAVAVSMHGEYPKRGQDIGTYAVSYFVEMIGQDDPVIPQAHRDGWITELTNHTKGTVMSYEVKFWGNTVHGFSIKYSNAVYDVISAVNRVPANFSKGYYSVPGINEYDPVVASAAFDRVDNLFEKYGLINSDKLSTCGDVKTMYRDQGCCGQPRKAFQGGRRLKAAGVSLYDGIKAELQKARARGGENEVKGLKKALLGFVEGQ
jgi:dienelactone hydrolase